MKKISPKAPVSFFGRTIEDKRTGAVFFNWSGSGFEFGFEGTRLDARLLALETVSPVEGTLWPWVSVYVDDEEKPIKDLAVDNPEQAYTLFSSAAPEKHRIKVVKRSENDKGKVGLLELETDGEISALDCPAHKKRLEFIGDSITCGFGNEAARGDALFSAGEENGQMAYPALTARMMNADYHSVCVSGISLCSPLEPNVKLKVPGFPGLEVSIRAMEDYYEFTDRLFEERRGESGFERWDFAKFRPDAVVVNLGTNDSYRIKASVSKAEEERFFEARYKAFIYKIRELNGLAPVICCTLGPMDYYLYDNILRAVGAYKDETSDEKIFCYKFGGIFPIDEGYGAQMHPSVRTHQRMAAEMCEVLKSWL